MCIRDSVMPVPEPTINTIEPVAVVNTPESSESSESSKKALVSIIEEKIVPTFDVVRIEKNGRLVIAGRWLPHSNVSIIMNGNIVVTELTNERGEFVYAPSKEYVSGNYTIRLLGVEQETKSVEDVFVYIAPKENLKGSLLSLIHI